MAFPHDGKKFSKGKSGNPNGRPKEIPDLKAILANVLGDEKDGKTAMEAIVMGLRAKAVKGDIRAAELLLDRAYGKARWDIDAEISVTEVIMPKPPSQTASE